MQRPKRKGSNQLNNKEKILCSHLTAQQWAQEAKKKVGGPASPAMGIRSKRRLSL